MKATDRTALYAHSAKAEGLRSGGDKTSRPKLEYWQLYPLTATSQKKQATTD